jgi:hypothetical protein
MSAPLRAARAAPAPQPPRCTAASVRCPESRNLRQVTPPCCVEKVHALLAFAAAELTRLGVVWWADYGTLLGAVKCGGQYPKDKDGDLSAVQMSETQLRALELAAVKAGFAFQYNAPRLSGPYGGGDSVKFRFSATNHNSVDVFFWHQHVNGVCADLLCQDKLRGPVPSSLVQTRDGINWHRRAYFSVDQQKGKEIPDAKLFPLTAVEYEGLTLPAPSSVHEPGPVTPSWFLEHRYGEEWQDDRDQAHDGRRR